MARDKTKLHPKVQALADRLVVLCAEQGLKIKITDCLRTEAEQNALPSTVTTVRYPNSYHCWGIAFDFCRNDGKGAYNTKDQFFEKVGKIGKSIGLVWGGDWKSFQDRPHFQWEQLGTRAQIQAGCGTPSKFLASFGVNIFDKPKKSVKKSSSKEDIKWLQNQLNIVLYLKLATDGKYGNNTARAVLKYWARLGWNRDGKDNGTVAGAKTIKALDAHRTI